MIRPFVLVYIKPSGVVEPVVVVVVLASVVVVAGIVVVAGGIVLVEIFALILNTACTVVS